MKTGKILLLITTIATFVCSNNCYSQNNCYGRIQLGTAATTDSFKGAEMSLSIGKRYKGIDANLALCFYNRIWNDNSFQWIQFDKYDNSSISSCSLDGKSRCMDIMIKASFGYDLLHIVKLKKHTHHFSPYVTVGYAHKFESSSVMDDRITDGLYQTELYNQSTSGFETSLGCRYDYDITKKISMGAFYEIYFLIKEKDVVGISMSYTFK